MPSPVISMASNCSWPGNHTVVLIRVPIFRLIIAVISGLFEQDRHTSVIKYRIRDGNRTTYKNNYIFQ